MRDNPIRERWRAGQAVVNGWLSLTDPFAAEVMAHQGWDSVTIDLQHGVSDYLSAVGQIRAIDGAGVAPLVRVPWNDPGVIMKCLDAGAMGVICPMVNDREQAERFVGACRYPPRGYRSNGPIRAALSIGGDYQMHADTLVLAIAMIETREAIDNLDAILSVPGLDAIYIGPSDLSLSLGGPAVLDHADGPAFDAIRHILDRAKVHGVPAGIHTGDPLYALGMIERGAALVTVGSDARFIAQGSQAVLSVMRGAAGGAGPGY